MKYVITISHTYWKQTHKGWETFTPEKRQRVIDAKLDEIDKYLSRNPNIQVNNSLIKIIPL
jgi:hypothetical protein